MWCACIQTRKLANKKKMHHWFLKRIKDQWVFTCYRKVFIADTVNCCLILNMYSTLFWKPCKQRIFQVYIQLNPLSAKNWPKSKVKVTFCQRAPRLPTSPSLITLQFEALVVSLLDIVHRGVFMAIYYPYGT